MNRFAQAGAVLAIATLAATGANAQAKKYGSEAGWDIFISDAMVPGCLIAKKLSPDVQLEMGIDATGGQLIGYMALYTKADANVTQGQQLPVTFDVDGQPFTGTATAQQMPGFRGGSVPVNNIDFIYNLAKKHKLTITPEGRKPMKGYVYIDPPGLAEDRDLTAWVSWCAGYVAGLPAKVPK